MIEISKGNALGKGKPVDSISTERSTTQTNNDSRCALEMTLLLTCVLKLLRQNQRCYSRFQIHWRRLVFCFIVRFVISFMITFKVLDKSESGLESNCELRNAFICMCFARITGLKWDLTFFKIKNQIIL